MRTLAFALVVVMLAVGIGVAVLLSSASRDGGVSVPSSQRPSAAAAPSAATEPSPATAQPAAFAFGEPDAASPMPDTAQSRLWFNDGSWWGVFLAATTEDQRIYRLDLASNTWTDTGIVVDDRVFARMDVLWDGQALVVASAGPQPDPRHALVVNRFSYDESTRLYRRDPNFPVPLTTVGVDGVTIARGADGTLWVAYVQGGRMAIDHSVGTDLAWQGPIEPSFSGGAIDEVAIASVGEAIAVVWTGPSDRSLAVAWHVAAEPSDVWRVAAPATASLGPGTRHFNLTVDPSPGAERLFVVTTTGVDALAERGRLDAQVVLVELPQSGEPKTFLVSRVEDEHTDPIVVVDSASRQLYVLAAAPKAGGAIYYKTASLDDVEFATGVGTPLIGADDENSRFAHPTSTKQALDGRSGLVVAATDSPTGMYGFAAVGVVSSPGQPLTPGESSAPLVEQNFDGLRVGGAVPGWVVDGDPAPEFDIRVLTGSNSSARLSSTATDARGCVSLPDVTTGVLRAELASLVNIASNDELHLIQLRGPAGELASVRLREGEVVYGTGASRVRTGVFLAPGRWYRSALTLDFAAQTYRLEIRDSTDDALLIEADDVPWRSTESLVANRLCVQLPPQPELDMYLDDVLVTMSGGDER